MSDEQELIKGIRARRAAGIADLGEEMRRRVRDFGDIHIDSDTRREAFSELAAPFEVAPFRLLIRSESVVIAAEQTVSLRMILVDVTRDGPVPVATIERTFALADAQVDHAYLTVSESYRGRSITPRIMLASFARYDLLGIRTVTVHAGLGTGRFYWSGKVGFDFLRDADQRHVERWAAFVLGALNFPVDLEGISQPQQWALLGTTDDPPPTARFSDLASAIAKVSTALLDPNGTGIVGSVECASAEIEPGMVDLPKHLLRVSTENGLEWSAEVPLGKLIMLTGPDWWGKFDLTDPVGRSAYASSAQQSIVKTEARNSG